MANNYEMTGSVVKVGELQTFPSGFTKRELVINDNAFAGDVAKTVTTNGVLASVMIGERKEGDVMYAFPADKHDPGYKVFQWDKWETAKYATRNKESFDILKKYFLGHSE